MTDAFTKHFGSLEDARQSAKISYPLFDVVFLTVCAVITGAEGWEDIEDFGRAHLDWLQEKGLFQQGLPVHEMARFYEAHTIALLGNQPYIW